MQPVCLLERLHPLVLGVALPCDHRQLALARPDLRRQPARPRAARRRDREGDDERGERRVPLADAYLHCSSLISNMASGLQASRTRLTLRCRDVRVGRLEVLVQDRKLAARVELDDVAGHRPHVDRVPDRARLAFVAGRDPDLLGTDRVAAPVPLEHVRDADEPGHEHRRRVLVDLAGRADLLDPAGVEDGDPVAHRQRLLLVVRHVDERDPDLLLNPSSARSASPGGASGRARRAARRAGAPRAGSRSRARARRAGAGRRRAAPACAGRTSCSRTISSAASGRSRRSRLPTPRTRSPYSTFSPTVMCGNRA